MSAASPGPVGTPQTGETSTADEDSVAKLIEIARKPTVGQRLISWASRPPGRLYLSCCVIVALVLLYEDSVPGGHLPSFVIGMGGGGLLAAMGALRLGMALSIARPIIRRHWLRWTTPPLIAAAAIALSLTDAPLQARVEASSEDLMQARTLVDDTDSTPLNGEWFGFYPLESASFNEGVTLFTVEDAGLFRESGLAYSPDPLPTDVFVPGHRGLVYEHVFGPWYSWTSY
ncbi:hypothetical protein [Nocardiopsis ansamitocini]|uniref:Uncharacterized protein n=1 Tax=Nocardiopsis ansamitocini TaxID=1670832 RepID=A0A9W6P6P4_9ACTN|nr:hypothetical protein [Nocardiopsis ansamitocini]GLU48036.1 hypothetical protein Nans01_23870 [Nocardiopsis ansamitocini]